MNRKSRPPMGAHAWGRGHAPAFTLVELLVVIAVIGMLVAILLPAVQSARGVGRRAVCQNNLRQIGIALNAHHESFGHFPVGGWEVRLRQPPDLSKRQIAWSAYLLPYLEEQPLFDGLDLHKAFDHPDNAVAAATVLPVYICPTSPWGERLVEQRGPCHYGGIYGERITSPNNPPKGTMLYDTPVSTAMISDGISRTLIVAEDSRFPDGQWINGRNIFDQAMGINLAPEYENDIRSDHPGGAHGVRADGSVHFMDESMNLQVLAALCTRDGQELVGD